ncbi:MAG: M23 family metallopeptidase [Bacteroidaceae bacterium]|nr:M23 family metallopeptidase [Bacteroidaceae bacterium]
MMKKVVLIYLMLVSAILIYAQQATPSFVAPLGIDLLLSANFGELRANHFHSGLDFKTRGAVGYKVYAVDEGYVSRVAVSPWGYGKALYITHPSGYTSVYAHLDDFVGEIAAVVKRVQYERESYAIDTLLTPDVLPVTRGMYIAKSGNSGSSGGPHLHFEIRHTESESPIDPLIWYSHLIKDGVAPEPRLVALYMHDAAPAGVDVPKKVLQPERVSNNSYKTATDFEAWGRVSLGIKAYDRMSDTNNIYGVRQVRCWVDDSLLYESQIDSITFAETRYINSYIDYKELRSNKGSTIMRTAVLPGNGLTTIYGEMPGDGTFVIDQERAYRCRMELCDFYGNKSKVQFVIQGKPTTFAPQEPAGVFFDHRHDNEYATDEMNIYLPAGALYDDIYFEHSSKASVAQYSSVHKLHNAHVPLHKWCELAVKITCDTLPDEKYYLEYSYNGKKSEVIGRYEAGWYVARVRNLGQYAVVADLTSPEVVALKPESWVANGVVDFKISDKGSGVHTYRVEVDGAYSLFEYDAKRSRLSSRVADMPLVKGRVHNITVSVTDNCGNETRKEYTIKI